MFWGPHRERNSTAVVVSFISSVVPFKEDKEPVEVSLLA